MDIFERWFEQDLTKKVGIQHAESLAFSGNNASNVVGVYVYKDGAPAELAGTVTGTVIRPDGMTVPLTGTLDGNAVSITLTEACFAVPGYIGVALTVTSGDITMTVLKATFEVEPIETDTVVDPSGEITANVAELISSIEAAVATIPPSYSDLLAAVAPTFDPEASTPYQSGAYVWYSGALHRFIADHTGAWTGTDAVSVNVGEEISELKSAFDANIGSVSGNLYKRSDITNNQYYKEDGSTIASTSWATVLIDIDGYALLTYSGLTGAGSDAVQSCWFDENDVCIGHFKQAIGENTIDIPANAKYVGFSINNSQTVLNSFSVIGEKKGSIIQDIENIDEDIQNIVANIGNASANLYSRSNITNRQYYQDDGQTVSNSSFATVLIDVSQYDTIIYSGITNVGSAAIVSCFFGANEEFISSFKQAIGTNVIDRPTSAKYVGFSINNSASVLNGFSVIGASADSVKKDLILISDAVEENTKVGTALNNIVGAETFTGVFDYQIKGIGKQDVIWSWWTRPACVHYKGVRDRIYYGYTTQDGYSGIGMYDCDSGLMEKTHLKKDGVDDHNACAVMVQPDRHILAAYPVGHNSAAGVFVRRSTFAESIEKWNDPIQLVSEAGTVSYAQILYANGKYWLFYRTTIYRWYYRTSTNAVTWSDEKALIVGSEQYYALFVTTSDNTKIRFCCTANPSYTDVNVRMGFIDTDTEAVYNADGTTVVRASTADLSTPIANTLFTILINAPSSGTLRVFDVLRGSAVGDVKILYTLFSDDTDSKYYLYSNGSSVELCNGGKSLWNSKYQLGASFVDDTAIVIARNDVGTSTDILEIVGFDGTLKKTLFSETIGSIPVRNARPVVTPDGFGVVWQRGYYNSANYTNFDMDACIYFDDKLVI